MLQNQEFIKEFVEEALGHVENVENGLLQMEGNDPDPEVINGIFRSVHSIKGTAGFFGLKKIVELSHAMENLFGELRNQRLNMNPAMMDALLSANDSLKELILRVEECEEQEISVHTVKIEAILKGETMNSDGRDGSQRQAVSSRNEGAIRSKNRQEALLHQAEMNPVREARKRGYKLYKVRLRMNEDLEAVGETPLTFFRRAESVGNILETHSDFSEISGLDQVLDRDITFTFLLTTVLDRSLVGLTLGISEDRIQELDINTSASRYRQIVAEGSLGLQEEMAEESAAEQMEEHAPAETLSICGPQVSTDMEDRAVSLVREEKKSKGTVAVEDSIRVHVSLLNDLLNLASEMVLGRNQLLRVMEGHRKSISGLDPILQNIDYITTELQEKIMQTRMQPVANVFNKFPRLIRELSKMLNKDVELNMTGTEVELDKSIIESLADPLTHLLRNAVDHGIESPQERLAAGKPKNGTVSIKAYHEGGYVNIDIEDDGAGIDVDKIGQKALQKEIITLSELSAMGEKEILGLLFKPGFSTAEKVTDVSGRGVGMDVVKTNIEKLGGTVEILSIPGKGTTFRLILPLTLAIIPSLIVEVEGLRFALPQVNLQEMVRIKPGDEVRRIEQVQNSQVLRLRGRLVPIIHLSDVLDLPRTQDKDSLVRVLILKIGSRRFGLVVDVIHDGEEILVKPLPRFLKDCRCYSGVTIMGDGRTAMILDPEGIAAKASLKFNEEKAEPSEKEALELHNSQKEQQNLLLFQCSGPEIFGLDLSMVARVEEIELDRIERVGDKEYIQFRDSVLRVIRPEHFLPVGSAGDTPEKLYVIIPKLVKHPMGILIHRIQDNVQAAIRFSQDDIKAKGVVGTCILRNRLVLVMNLYELFEMAAPDLYEVEDPFMKSGNRKIVLVVEDTPFFQKMEQNYLEWAGYQVLTAQHGEEALDILQKHPVDAVISDINMPVMDGMELIKRIRADRQFSSLPVIAVTSMTGENITQSGLNAGFDYYETKLDKLRLLQKLEQAIAKRREVV